MNGIHPSSPCALQIFATLVAGAVHDFKHPGFNNYFLVVNNDDIALRYNDSAVLENYHLAETFLMCKVGGREGWREKKNEAERNKSYRDG